MIDQTQLVQLCINTIPTLSIDAVQKAQSGHPGTPMGAVPTVYCLWQRCLRYDPGNTEWPNRNRFVFSACYALALLYSLLYLCGVKAKSPSYKLADRLPVTLNEPQNFRQAQSFTDQGCRAAFSFESARCGGCQGTNHAQCFEEMSMNPIELSRSRNLSSTGGTK